MIEPSGRIDLSVDEMYVDPPRPWPVMWGRHVFSEWFRSQSAELHVGSGYMVEHFRLVLHGLFNMIHWEMDHREDCSALAHEAVRAGLSCAPDYLMLAVDRIDAGLHTYQMENGRGAHEWLQERGVYPEVEQEEEAA